MLLVCNSYSQLRWVKRYDGEIHSLDYATDVKIYGNKTYVAGSSWGAITNTDFTVVKYDLESGAQEWVYRYNSPDSGTDNANSLAVDAQGYIYVTGSVNNREPSGVDMFTMSITSTGSVRWMKEYTGNLDGVDQGLKIMTDNNRNVYVMGVTSTQTGDFDIIVIKYSEPGNEIWKRQYESPQTQMPKDMYVDKTTGEVFITGYSGNNLTDYLTLMINTQGSIQWTRLFGGTANQEDIAESIGHNIFTGDLYITGKCQNTLTGVGITTICYSRNGEQRWVSRYDCPVAGGSSTGYDVEFAGENTIFVSAAGNENNMAQSTGLVLGLDTMGNLKWKNIYASRLGNFSSQNIPSGMKITASGMAYISATGYDSSFGVGNNFMMARVTRYGALGLTQYNSTFSDFTSAIDVSNNRAVITGSSDTTGHSSDMLTVMFKGNGEAFSSRNRKVIVSNSNEYDSMYVPQFGNYGDAANISNIRVTIDTIFFPQDGDLELYLAHNGFTDTLVYHSGGSGDNFIATNLQDSATSFISGGTAPFTGSFKPHQSLSVFNGIEVSGLWVLRIKNTGNQQGELRGWTLEFDIDENTLGIQPVSNEIPKSYSLSQNYPNPFNPVTNINFSVPISRLVILKVYDITGKEVAQLVNKTMAAGVYTYDFNASQLSSGVYFYRMTAGDFTEVKKMVLVK